MKVLIQPSRETSTCLDRTTFCRLDELGLQVLEQRLRAPAQLRPRVPQPHQLHRQEPGPGELTAARTLRTALREAVIGSGDQSRTAEPSPAFPCKLAADSDERLGLASVGASTGHGAIIEAVGVSVADRLWAFYDTVADHDGLPISLNGSWWHCH